MNLKRSAAKNLIPNTTGTTPSYWCTWAVQNYVYGQGMDTFDCSVLEGSYGAQLARNSLTEERLLGTNGWLRSFYPTIRGDLYVVLDDGWDVPFDVDKQSGCFGNVSLCHERFPSFTSNPHLAADFYPVAEKETHDDPSARLARLNDSVRALGWKGLGLWIAAQEATAYNGPQVSQEEYWRARLRWCHAAGISYWKVDWGTHAAKPEFRSLLTALARQEAPQLMIEHIRGIGPLNTENGRVSSEFIDCTSRLLHIADVVRTYDVTAALSIPTTLDRLANLLAAAPTGCNEHGLINCEDEPLIGAALGCALGIMRHPQVGLRAQNDPDPFFAGPLNNKKCLDEVIRAIRWQRLAPSFGVTPNSTRIDTDILWDEWIFRRGETWVNKVIGQRIRQGAPARITRNLPLPLVNADGRPPYVLASLNPNGAVTIATLGRTSPEHGRYTPLADITVNLGDADGPIGVFGEYRSLTLEYSHSVEHAHVWAQDLATDVCVEITSAVQQTGNQLCLPGEVIAKVGLCGRTAGDLSAPGLVVIVE